MSIIPYSATTSFGNITAVRVGDAIDVLAELKRVKDAANALAFSATSPPNWALLETNSDFMVGNGKGESWYTAVDSLVAALSASPVTAAFANLDKGV